MMTKKLIKSLLVNFLLLLSFAVNAQLRISDMSTISIDSVQDSDLLLTVDLDELLAANRTKNITYGLLKEFLTSSFVDLSSSQTITGDKTFSGTVTVGTLNGILKGSAGVIGTGTVDLISDISGILPVANGGTGSATKNFVDLTTDQSIAGDKSFISTGYVLLPNGSTAQRPGTPSSGMVRYNTDTPGFEGYSSGAWGALGGGAGGGLDAFLSEDYETTQATNFGTGNNAAFLTAGSIDGAISNETASPIAGARSIKYTASTASTNDWVSSPAISLDAKQSGQHIGISFYYKWSGSVNVSFVVKCTAGDTATFTDSLDVVETASASTRFSTSVFISPACTEIKYGFHLTNAPTSGDVLVWDDVELSTNPFVYKNLTEISSVLAEGNAGTAITAATTDIDFTEVSDSRGAWSGTAYTVQNSDSVISLKTVVRFTTSGTRIVELYKNGTVYKNIGASNGSNTEETGSYVSSKGEFSAGDLLTFRVETVGGTLLNDSETHYLNIIESFESEHVITPAKSNMTNMASAGLTTSDFVGFGTVSNIDVNYKQVGDLYYIEGSFTVGTPTAVEAQINLPNSKTIKSGKAIKSVGVYNRSNGGLVSKGGMMLSTGGDGFLNFGSSSTFSGTTADPNAPISSASSDFTSGDTVHFWAWVEIEGLTSDAIFLAALPTKPASFYAKTPSGSPPSTLSDVVFTVEEYDTMNGFDTTTGVYTVQATGYYQVNTSLAIDGTFSAGQAGDISVLVNGTRKLSGRSIAVGNYTASETPQTSGVLYLTKGDAVKVQAIFAATGGSWYGDANGYCHFSITSTGIVSPNE